MKTMIKRWISVILVFVMVLQMAPIQVLATNTGSTATPAEESAAVTEVSIPPSGVPTDVDAAYAEAYAAGELFIPDHPDIKREVYERRTATEKHFEMADGTFTAVAYAYPVHYEEDGIWKDYDNTLSLTQSSGGAALMAVNGTDIVSVQTYETVNGDMTRSFVTGEDGTELYSIEKNGIGFSFGLLNADDEAELAALEAGEELETESETPAEDETASDPEVPGEEESASQPETPAEGEMTDQTETPSEETTVEPETPGEDEGSTSAP